MTSTDRPIGGGTHHYTDEEMHNEDVAHEHSDVSFRTVLAFGGAMAVMVAVSAALMYGLFVVLERQAKRSDPQVSPHAITAGEKPKGPPLLRDEPGNLRKFRMEETKKLESYGWMDQRAGIAQVPVEQAKKLVVEHGLPVRAGAPADDTLGTHAPAYGEASGGRTIPTKHAAPATPAQPGPASPPPIVPEIKK
jgi:hypothetical protein